MQTTISVESFFANLFADLRCQPDTRAYIVSIYGKFKHADFDLSQHNITLAFCQARQNRNFASYRTLGDWIFFANTWAPAHLRFASKDYYDTIARSSYYSCYRLLNRQWKCFEEIADLFPELEEQVKLRLVEFGALVPRSLDEHD